MKRITISPIIALFIVFGLSACKPNNTASTTTDNKNDGGPPPAQAKSQTASYAAADSIEEVLGSYVGAFGDNKITLLITKAGGGLISGRSIVGGNDRPFDGTLSLDGDTYNVEAREPGDHKDDGVFKFHIDKANLNAVKGTWKANDTKRPEKSYSLERRKFDYRQDVGEYPQASQRLLKTADVENMMKEDLEFMRNEIFARHGYCFAKKDLRQMFENEDWYVPNTVDIRNLLTDVEKKNIALIKRYEKYADEYGDSYGR